MKKLEERILRLEALVFSLLEEKKEAEKCSKCSESAKDLAENDLIFETSLCNDCFDNTFQGQRS